MRHALNVFDAGKSTRRGEDGGAVSRRTNTRSDCEWIIEFSLREKRGTTRERESRSSGRERVSDA